MRHTKRVRVLIAAAAAMLPVSGFRTPASANELRVDTVGVQRNTTSTMLRVESTVRWRNGWRHDRNHDAVWVIVKLRGNARTAWTQGRMVRATVAGAPEAACTVSADQVGAFCAPLASHRSDVTWKVTFAVEPVGLRESDVAAGTVEAHVFGVEMVHIPAGPFSIGDADPKSVEGNAFYRSDAQGNHAGTLRITSEAAIPVGRQDGSLFYRSGQYAGDAIGPVPEAFPKGTRAFYVMKYEILQGQYATFLNLIGSQAAAFRTPIGTLGYSDQRGSIRIENGRYVAGAPDRPANWVSWDDGCAFADWAGLRPWTELEFTKAARGPGEPVANDFPWGTASKDRLLRRNQPTDELLQTGDADESRLTDTTRDVLGASFYWVMDLSGSVWEKVVTIGHPRGRAFQGSHGDGRLADYGVATNADWPLGDHEAGGYGYRGGGYYERGYVDTALNPHSRVEQRPYGSWGGGPRSVAYGFRAARTAER
jgi:formylglycine-generating enzyme required for sulfatase activity